MYLLFSKANWGLQNTAHSLHITWKSDRSDLLGSFVSIKSMLSLLVLILHTHSQCSRLSLWREPNRLCVVFDPQSFLTARKQILIRKNPHAITIWNHNNMITRGKKRQYWASNKKTKRCKPKVFKLTNILFIGTYIYIFSVVNIFSNIVSIKFAQMLGRNIEIIKKYICYTKAAFVHELCKYFLNVYHNVLAINCSTVGLALQCSTGAVFIDLWNQCLNEAQEPYPQDAIKLLCAWSEVTLLQWNRAY